MERKIAQCSFHKNKGCDKAKAILNLLPGGEQAYTSHPEEHEDDLEYWSFHDFFGASSISREPWSRIRSFISEWLPDVTKVVDALFEAGLDMKSLAQNATLQVV